MLWLLNGVFFKMILIEGDKEYMILRYEGAVFILTHREAQKLMIDLQGFYNKGEVSRK